MRKRFPPKLKATKLQIDVETELQIGGKLSKSLQLFHKRHLPIFAN